MPTTNFVLAVTSVVSLCVSHAIVIVEPEIPKPSILVIGLEAAFLSQKHSLEQFITTNKSGLIETTFQENANDLAAYCERFKTNGSAALSDFEENLGVANDVSPLSTCGGRPPSANGCYWNVNELLAMNFDAGVRKRLSFLPRRRS
jgi:hypothetical protein